LGEGHGGYNIVTAGEFLKQISFKKQLILISFLLEFIAICFFYILLYGTSF
jgi:hypothetical protein